MKKKVLICTLHDKILEDAEELSQFDFAPGQKLKAKKLIKKIIESTEKAKESGQEMEDRLIEYYNAVSGLGFRRIK